MQSSFAAPAAATPLTISLSLAAICLFCLLGVAISVAIIPHLPPDQLAWVLAHAE